MVTHPIIIGDADLVSRRLSAAGTWWRVALGMLVGLVLGGAVVWATPPVYAATVAVQLSQVSPSTDVNPAGPDATELSIDTDAQLVTSDAVLGAVAATTGSTPDEARQALSISARPLSRVMELTYTADSPDVARAGATAAAAAVLEERERLVIQPVREYLSMMSRRGIEGAQEASDGTTTDETQVDDATNEVRRRLAITQQMRLAGPGEILEDAHITADADRGDIEVPLASGAAAGALATLMLVVAGERRRMRVMKS